MTLPIFLCFLSLSQVSFANTTSSDDYATDLPGCDNAIMKLSYFLTGVLVPWFLSFFFCFLFCVIKNHWNPNSKMPLQPVQMPVIVHQYGNQPVFNNNNTQQINYEMTQQGQIPGGMLQQGHYPEGMPNMVPGYVGYQWGQ